MNSATMKISLYLKDAQKLRLKNVKHNAQELNVIGSYLLLLIIALKSDNKLGSCKHTQDQSQFVKS